MGSVSVKKINFQNKNKKTKRNNSKQPENSIFFFHFSTVSKFVYIAKGTGTKVNKMIGIVKATQITKE